MLLVPCRCLTGCADVYLAHVHAKLWGWPRTPSCSRVSARRCMIHHPWTCTSQDHQAFGTRSTSEKEMGWASALHSHAFKLHEILDRLHLTLFFLKPWLIFSTLFSFFFTPTYFLYLRHFKLSHLGYFFQSAGSALSPTAVSQHCLRLSGLFRIY